MKNKTLAIQYIARGYFRFRVYNAPPVIIGGCERSGTTLLHRILSAHSKIVAIPVESWALCYSPVAGFKGSRPIRWLRLLRALGEFKILDGKENATRWSEKTPANIFHFNEIAKAFNFKVKRIQIVRDGRDVILSRYPGDPSRPHVPIKRWIESVQAGLAFVNDPAILTIRYEDLITDTDETLKKICEYIEEDDENLSSTWFDIAALRDDHSGPIKSIPQSPSEISRYIGKWRVKNHHWADSVETLMSDADAVYLLKKYNYITES
jgi:hypothetical protein